jgi:hypothetical protein
MAHLSGNEGFCKTSDDQIRTIEFAFNDSTYTDYIDWTMDVTVMGYSMGGYATLNSASNQDYVT